MADLYVALIHHPVLDRNGAIVTSAITSLDVHDIARSSRTYGVRAFFVVNPISEQRAFAIQLLQHWLSGPGRSLDSRRRDALELVRIVDDLDDAIAEVEHLSKAPPLLVYTSARLRDGVSFEELRRRIEAPGALPAMVLLGTGFGMAPAIEERVDLALQPLLGTADYNHLSVRAAASIILDRLRGR